MPRRRKHVNHYARSVIDSHGGRRVAAGVNERWRYAVNDGTTKTVTRFSGFLAETEYSVILCNS